MLGFALSRVAIIPIESFDTSEIEHAYIIEIYACAATSAKRKGAQPALRPFVRSEGGWT
jgi:hypothetical protein